MTPADERAAYRLPGRHVDADHPGVVELARRTTTGLAAERERAVALYYAVRDGFRYDPYLVRPDAGCFTASTVIETGSGFCISKAALLAALARASGIPARVGFADVKNHLTSPRLRRMMGSDEFLYHGYTEMWIEGRWVKCTPAFDRALCDKARVQPLEFDGRDDSLFHPLDREGRRHMEYLRDHGSRVDVPGDEIIDAWKRFYPQLDRWGERVAGARFESEVSAG